MGEAKCRYVKFHYAECCYANCHDAEFCYHCAECHYAKCSYPLSGIMLNVIMQNVVEPKTLAPQKEEIQFFYECKFPKKTFYRHNVLRVTLLSLFILEEHFCPSKTFVRKARAYPPMLHSNNIF
jgi:hypothetical protein